MSTIKYKGFYINCHCDKPNCFAFGIIQGRRYEKHFVSQLSAKRWITQVINNWYPKGA